jgi:hypothetical protein
MSLWESTFFHNENERKVPPGCLCDILVFYSRLDIDNHLGSLHNSAEEFPLNVKKRKRKPILLLLQ